MSKYSPRQMPPLRKSENTPESAADIAIQVGLSSRPFAPFPIECLPPVIRKYVVQCSRALGCDPMFLILPVLCTFSAAIGNSSRIQLKKGWSEPACIWGALIAKSGTLKSPAIAQAIAPLIHVQERAIVKFKEEFSRYNEALKNAKESKGRRGFSDDEDQPSAEAKPPVLKRYVCSDITVEALADRLSENRRGLLVCRDELAGLLRSFDQYKGGRGGDVAHWLEMHRAGSIFIDRKTAAKPVIYLPRAFVSLLGGIQPATLMRVLGEEHFENGLAARLLMAMPPSTPKVWNEHEIADSDRLPYEEAIAAALGVNCEDGPDGSFQPLMFRLSPGARELWRFFYNSHGKAQVEADDELASAFSKLEAYAARLALVFHISKWAADSTSNSIGLEIDAQTMREAITATLWFCEETRRVYAIIRESALQGVSRKLIELIERNGGVMTARRLQQLSRDHKRSETASKSLEGLVDAGMGEWRNIPTGPKGEAPTREFVLFESGLRRQRLLNPDIDEGGSVGSVDRRHEHTAQMRAPTADENANTRTPNGCDITKDSKDFYGHGDEIIPTASELSIAEHSDGNCLHNPQTTRSADTQPRGANTPDLDTSTRLHNLHNPSDGDDGNTEFEEGLA